MALWCHAFADRCRRLDHRRGSFAGGRTRDAIGSKTGSGGHERGPPAGALARPDVTATLTDIEYLSTGMVRVLDETQAAVGPWNPHLEPAELQVGLRHMLLTRIFDQRMQNIQRQGRISFYIRSLGEEAVWRNHPS